MSDVTDPTWTDIWTPAQGLLRLRPNPARIAVGSLAGEFERARLTEAPTVLAHLAGAPEDRQSLTVLLPGDGRLHVARRSGQDRSAVSAVLPAGDGAGLLRFTYAWDEGRGVATLTVEDPAARTATQREEPAEGGLAFRGPRGLTALAGAPHPAVEWIALGRGFCPAAIGGCIAADTAVDTPDGPRQAAALEPGDAVLAPDGKTRRVLWVARHEMPAAGSFRRVRLLAPHFGATTDVTVSPLQRLLLSGPDVEYLFDAERVLVEARHLVDGRTAVFDGTAATAKWVACLLDEHSALTADGCHVESAFSGRSAQSAEFALTTCFAPLAVSGAMPAHSRQSWPILRGFEARALAEARSRRRSPFAA